jgi:hypothetical protein
MDRRTGEISASPARTSRRSPGTYSRRGEMSSRHAETSRRTARMHRDPGGLVARSDHMHGNIARFAIAHDRTFASTAHCSRRTSHCSTSSGYPERDSDDSSLRTTHGYSVPPTSDLIPPTSHLIPATSHFISPTSHSIPTMSIILPLEARPPTPNRSMLTTT